SGPQRVYESCPREWGPEIYVVPEYGFGVVFTRGDYNSGGSPPNIITAKIILPKLISTRTRNAEPRR
ncbi:MAG TPA: hypothetical protein VFO27_16460, partial [Bryobacteraceae bacterium]|nr:hypothetical protein [Bryobacteraceae bacterium]